MGLSFWLHHYMAKFKEARCGLGLCFVFFLMACSAPKELELESGSSETITGKIAGFSSGSSLSLSASDDPTVRAFSCSSPTASLYVLDADGNRTEPALGSTSISDDGSYTFDAKTLGVSLTGGTPSLPLIIAVSGCSSAYFRPLTGAREQNISMGSTVLGYLLNTPNKSKLTLALKSNLSEVNDLINQLEKV